jgi:hypothetical protein
MPPANGLSPISRMVMESATKKQIRITRKPAAGQFSGKRVTRVTEDSVSNRDDYAFYTNHF